MWIFDDKLVRNWFTKTNVIFIIENYQLLKNSESYKKLKKLYKCTDLQEISQDSVENFVTKKTNKTKFIIDKNNLKLNTVLDIIKKSQFQPIIGKYDRDSEKMEKTVEGKIVFIGWFFSNYDQKKLHSRGRQVKNIILNQDSIEAQLKLKIKQDPLKDFWVTQKSRLHITAMYFGKNDKTEQAQKYLQSVRDKFYNVIRVSTRGILLTPRTISCHAELPSDTESMFFPDKEEDFELSPHVTLAVAPNFTPYDSLKDQNAVQNMRREKKSPKNVFETKLGNIEDWEDCQYYMVLKKPLSFSVMFLPY